MYESLGSKLLFFTSGGLIQVDSLMALLTRTSYNYPNDPASGDSVFSSCLTWRIHRMMNGREGSVFFPITLWTNRSVSSISRVSLLSASGCMFAAEGEPPID